MRGFTLLEVMVALIIAGIAAVALFEAAGAGLHASQTASMYEQAIVRAKSRLAAAAHGTRLVSGEQSGEEGRFQWRVRVAQVAAASSRPGSLIGVRRATMAPVVLYAVTVWVGWNDGGTERQVRLDTQQVGG